MEGLQKKWRKNDAGFTLVEISIGVVIVGIIFSLAVMGLGSSKGDSQAQKRSAMIQSIEQAKNRYILATDSNVLAKNTLLNQIAPYLKTGGEPVQSLFDLVEGTGKSTNDIDLGSYGVRPANFEKGEMLASSANAGPFNTNDPIAAQAALSQLASMDPSDPNYQELSDALQEALDNGSLTNQDFTSAGLVNVDGTWMTQQEANDQWALQAQQLLTTGGNWNQLSQDQRSAYANAFPQNAVTYGGADALNKMNPTLLTTNLVSGFAKVSGSWESPLATSAPGVYGTMDTWWLGGGSPSSSQMSAPNVLLEPPPEPVGSKRYVYMITNPLSPAVYLGDLTYRSGTNYYSSGPVPWEGWRHDLPSPGSPKYNWPGAYGWTNLMASSFYTMSTNQKLIYSSTPPGP